MCGITGMLNFDKAKGADIGLLNRMTDILAHRGPDDRGVFIDNNLGLGFRRLSIIDLSSHAHQPMCNEDETVYLVCNGEIYNFQELRKALEGKGHVFKSHTDIEVIIHAYEEYGAGCLEYIDGMFAFAIWDRKKHELFLARDRFGIKPLHYACKNGIFTFASEIKSLLCVPETTRDMDEQALWNYCSLMHIPAPQTIYRDIKKFLPSQAMIVKEDGSRKTWQYWDMRIKEDDAGTERKWIEELSALFERSIKTHLVADVPIGCFLSGGIDSGAITAYASKIRKEPIKTYSMSFIDDGDEFDESPMQRLIADTFQTEHHEIRVKPDILDVVGLLTQECDEPFAVPSAIGLYHVSRLASRDVKVVLSGDGGDELFAGYSPRYDRDRLFYWAGSNKSSAKKLLRAMAGLIPARSEKISPLRKIRKALEFSSMSDSERYACMLSIYSAEAKMALFQEDFIRRIDSSSINEYYDGLWNAFRLNRINQRLYYDIKTSLADEMLTKMDRCTSMVSIEGRVPFLDKSFAECAMKVPARLKYSHGNGKKIFKKLLNGILPDRVLNGRKKGFNVPVNKWMLAYDEDIEYNRNIFNNSYISQLRKRYHGGDKRFGYHFWILKCFSVWEELQKRNSRNR